MRYLCLSVNNMIMTSIMTLLILSCQKNDHHHGKDKIAPILFNPELTYGKMNDQDGNTYRTIKIGTQTWMAENLRTTKFRNGENIPKVALFADSISKYFTEIKYGAHASYEDTTDQSFIEIYGRTYNWYAAVDKRQLAPVGWHVPSANEWKILTNFLGSIADGDNKLRESGNAHWSKKNYVANTNASGFSAISADRLQVDYMSTSINYPDDDPVLLTRSINLTNLEFVDYSLQGFCPVRLIKNE